jgi:hypothetical protein
MNKELTPYQSACKVLGIKPIPELKYRTNLDDVSVDAYKRLIICIRAKNTIDGKPWVPVYDGNETHYWPYFRKNTSGFGFSHAAYGHWLTRTDVGSRLEYRSRQLAEEGAREFESLYNDYFNQ